MMTTTKILFKKTGENFTTPADPLRVYNEETDAALLTVTETFCVSFDNDMLVTGNLYEVHEVTLPSWLAPAEWITNCVQWKYTWGCGVDPTWEESWQRGLLGMSTVERVAIVKLLKTKNFRSEFRKSMRDQIVAWLATPAADRKYRSPLSPRQMDAICDKYTCLDARRLDSTLYSDRHYRGAPVSA